MTEKLEQAKDLLESLAARKIGGTHYIMNSEDGRSTTLGKCLNIAASARRSVIVNNEMDVWIALQRGESLKIEDIAKAIYGVDVSSYIKTDTKKELKRYREGSRGCDGTAALTIQTLCEMIEPIINRQVHDKEKGEPNGNEIGIIYYCSPITYTNEMKRGKLQGGYEGDIQVDTFHINYTSEFIYN